MKPTEIKEMNIDNNWNRIEIFLKAYGRLPTEEADRVNQETLDLFCKRFEAGEIKTTTVPLVLLYDGIKEGKIKPLG